ncbi:MAG: PspC domain-containing protein [Galactobacter sp.]|uniref:PspC domain-containing protein n=1 Tax=Galactobacter sp. TaxID=2676125 RepID=UPI0025BF17E1|nr:PspC domain-containing protein [Galactobacter sp.]
MLNGFFNLLRRQSLRRGPRRILGGVCHGISRSLGCDPGLVRLIVMVAMLLPFIGWLTYLVAWLLIPWRDESIVLERLIDSGRGRRRN